MMFPSHPARRRGPAAGSALALLLLSLAPCSARAQSRLEASYTISAARIPIGSTTLTADIGASEYTISVSGHVSGAMRVLAGGESSSVTRGTVAEGRLVPKTFTSKATSGSESLEVAMVLDDGNVKELDAKPPSGDRVPVTEAHRRAIIDPLTAMLLPAADKGPSPEVCQGTLAIFDGYQRFDLDLAFKRMDKVKAEQGYDGPAVMCSATHHPLGGHRASDPLINFLSGREIEVTLAPVAGTRVLAPFRLSITSLLANLTVVANRFEARP